ncbi:MAG: hypothetical protein ABSF69_30155 [Polyangiaceae bacterium]|jgi:hypothetical protein
MTSPPTFKDENRALQELTRELAVLRQHNLQFKEGDPQHALLMFAEAAVVCMTMEHFVRIVLGGTAPADATLFNLLQMAVSRGLLAVPWDDQQDGIKKIVAVRNSLLHGNYAQAAREAGCASVADYFRLQFAGEVETMTKVTDFMMRQIDPATGKAHAR